MHRHHAAILPYYVTLFYAASSRAPPWSPGAAGNLAGAGTLLRAVRLVRVFRIFKLGRYSAGMQVFSLARPTVLEPPPVTSTTNATFTPSHATPRRLTGLLGRACALGYFTGTARVFDDHHNHPVFFGHVPGRRRGRARSNFM